MAARKRPETPYFNALLVLLAAALFGWIVLPRLAPAQLAPDFLLPRLAAGGALSAEKVRLSDLGGKAVILDFWASWCMPCKAEMPVLDRVARANGKRGLVVLGVLSGDLPEDASEFLAQQPVSYGTVVDDQNQANSAYRVKGLPTLVVIDRKGGIVARRTGTVSEKELTALAELALR